MGSHTEENYLKTLLKLSDIKGQLNISELSAAMNVSVPTANSMVKKMHAHGWVKYEKYRPVVITPKGREVAALVVRKHRLTEMYLVERMGFSWEDVHEIAEQIEHVQSETFFDRMDELLGFPQFDPHGSPIPDKDGRTVDKDLVPLSDCQPGQKVRLQALAQSESSLLNFLNGKSLSLNAEITVLLKEPFDGSMEVSYVGRDKEVFSAQVCQKLLVSHQ